MNTKRAYKSDHKPEFLHTVDVMSGSKTYQINKGTLLSVRRKPGLIAGRYEFLYAERSGETLLLTVEGPVSRVVSERRRRMIRQADIKTVHISTRVRE